MPHSQAFTSVFDDLTPNLVWLVTMPELFDPSNVEASPGQAMAMSSIYSQARLR